jgi:hypothetical protein
MAGLTTSVAQAALDYLFPTSGAGDYVMYSANGTSETGLLGRTAIGATGWAAATSADPSVKANANALTSPTATGTVTISHAAIVSASSGGTQRTDWQALTGGSRALATGDTLTHAIGSVQVTLT